MVGGRASTVMQRAVQSVGYAQMASEIVGEPEKWVGRAEPEYGGGHSHLCCTAG